MNHFPNEVSNIVDLASVRFPVGAKAWHDIYRVCQIVECLGDQRKIKIMALGKKEMVVEYVTVHVNELKIMKIPSELQC